jgi:hypothetical protein
MLNFDRIVEAVVDRFAGVHVDVPMGSPTAGRWCASLRIRRDHIGVLNVGGGLNGVEKSDVRA